MFTTKVEFVVASSLLVQGCEWWEYWKNLVSYANYETLNESYLQRILQRIHGIKNLWTHDRLIQSQTG